MELFYQFLTGLLQTLGLATAIRLLSSLLSTQISYFYSFISGLVLLTAYQQFVYPYFNPLSRFPLVDINDIRVLLPVTDVPRGESALRWAKTYGNQDAIRVRVLRSSTALVPLSTDALRDLFGTHQQDFVKPVGGRNFLSRILGYGLILSEGKSHARQRKHLTTSFRIQNIRALHDLISLKSDILIKNMEAENERNGKIDITTWASKVTLDIIGEALMSTEFDSLNVEEQPVHEAFSHLTSASSGITFLFALSMILPKRVIQSIPTSTNREIEANIKLVRSSCEATLKEVYGKKNSDILASIISDPGASQQEIVDQMVTFLGAGHETTATSIAWITHLLTLPENRHYQDKLRAEVSLDHTAAELEALPWLNAICEETLRLFPPVTSTARLAIKDTTIAGARVPSGTIITIFPWAINRDPRHWSDAETFIPERWLDKKPDGTLYLNNHGGASSNYCNMTFLHGSRSCIGKTFAKAELRVVIAKLFGNFEVQRLPGDNGVVNPVGSLTIKPEGGLFVKLDRV